ncbi:GAD-like domain-containing protein (plasmid) [Rhizobium phaseoli]|uniref:GAD-like domain-containing protein n=1 Tax=Rhizobium phaseoli TaxID=396 RepID=UPI0007E9B0E8|nr:GAD-like domain-containing protein [Rhizobium phaseoli]ANL69595.1 GAD-like domain-containing protein [Rhizobium phaseoli]ANL82393.1 GAD-like domain-containing protein [Rhizobium phaseoli]
MSVTPRRPLQEVLDEFGPLKDGSTVSASQAEGYRGKLPDAMVDFWIEHGRGQWRDGLYWICDPEPIMPVLHMLFAGDQEFDSARMVPFMRDAFGEVSIWLPKFKLITLKMNLGTLTTTDITTHVIEGIPPFDDDMAVAAAVDASVFDINGWVDSTTGKPVFDAVRRRLGPISADQVYTMVPHLRLGGDGTARDFAIGGFIEYLVILSQMGPFTFERYVDPKEGGRGAFGHLEAVRTIGHDRLIDN